MRFVSHELAEYTIGAALVAIGVHETRGAAIEFITIGAALLALNLVTKATLGAVRKLSRRTHHILDGLIIVFCAASPFFGFVRHDVAAIAAAEAVALLLVFIEQSTRYRDPPGVPKRLIAARVVRPQVPEPDLVPRGESPVPPSVSAFAHRLGVVAGATKRLSRLLRATNDTTRGS